MSVTLESLPKKPTSQMDYDATQELVLSSVAWVVYLPDLGSDL